MKSLNAGGAVSIFAVLHLCTCSSAVPAVDSLVNHVVSACRRHCFEDVASDSLEIGFGDCFEACVESSMPTTSSSESLNEMEQVEAGEDPAESKREENNAFTSELKRKNRHHPGHQLSSRMAPRGIGSGSASKYLRIGRQSHVEGDSSRAEEATAENLQNGNDKRKASSALEKSPMGKLGSKNAKIYLRVGKKPVGVA